MVNSGLTAKVTSDDTAVVLLTWTNGREMNCTIINDGPVAGFFSDDAGTNWGRLPAGSSVTFRVLNGNASIQVKRIAGGSDLAGLYAWAV